MFGNSSLNWSIVEAKRQDDFERAELFRVGKRAMRSRTIQADLTVATAVTGLRYRIGILVINFGRKICGCQQRQSGSAMTPVIREVQ